MKNDVKGREEAILIIKEVFSIEVMFKVSEK